MEETTRYAVIPAIRKGVAFSDPLYGADVWCQYRQEFEASDWLLKMETKRGDDGIIEFELHMGRKTLLSGLSVIDEGETASISNYSHYKVDMTEIGIDSAHVFVGTLENFEGFGEEGSIYTAADGLFGNLCSFTVKGEQAPAGFLLMGSIDGDITDENELFLTVLSSFDGQETERNLYEHLTDKNDLDLRQLLAKEMRVAKAAEEREEGKRTSRRPPDLEH